MIDILIDLQSKLNNIAPTFINTPHKLASNQNKYWLVVSSITTPTQTRTFCSSIYTLNIQVFVIEAEKSSLTILTKQICNEVKQALRDYKQLDVDNLRVYETLVQEEMYNGTDLNNKEVWSINATITYGTST